MKVIKNFMYFEIEAGGMSAWQFSCDTDRIEQQLESLIGWKTPSCYDEDVELLEWSKSCKVGEYKEHRLGVLVRIIQN